VPGFGFGASHIMSGAPTPSASGMSDVPPVHGATQMRPAQMKKHLMWNRASRYLFFGEKQTIKINVPSPNLPVVGLTIQWVPSESRSHFEGIQ
jgi:hypothetical protein